MQSSSWEQARSSSPGPYLSAGNRSPGQRAGSPGSAKNCQFGSSVSHFRMSSNSPKATGTGVSMGGSRGQSPVRELYSSNDNTDGYTMVPKYEDLLIPPLNFGRVCRGVYRSGFPGKKNFLFLKKLGLSSVLNLSEHEYPPETVAFYHSNHISSTSLSVNVGPPE